MYRLSIKGYIIKMHVVALFGDLLCISIREGTKTFGSADDARTGVRKEKKKKRSFHDPSTELLGAF